ncbi:hypothetical protein HPP92_004721 [Vanilla planifolia]|nr:hypothetical protein HPP92_004721 [Vanilla planifolia]
MDDKPDCSLSELISESCNTKHVTVNQFGSNFANSGPVSEEIDSEGFRALRRKSLDSSVTDLGFQGFCNYCSHANAELALIRKQLLDIETKQSKLLDLLEVVDLSSTCTTKQLLLSRKTQVDFLCALKGIAEQECIDLEHQIFIAQVVARLSKEWGEAPTRRMPLPTRPNGSNNMVISARG